MMKKMIPVLAILGGAAAFAAYKLKKDEQKKIIDLDEGMLRDEDLSANDEETFEEGPISEPTSYSINGAKEAMKDLLDEADEFVKNTAEKVEDIAEETKQKAKKVVKDVNEVFPHLVEEEIQELKEKTKAIMDQMLEQGDVHEHERPVQHTVLFENEQDAENFKNTVINRGFVVTTGEEPFELIVLHITPLNEMKLIANILYIVNEVKSNHGTYQGWASKIAN